MKRQLHLLVLALSLAAFTLPTTCLWAQEPAETAEERERRKLEKQGYRDFTSADGSRTLFAKLEDVAPDKKSISITTATGQRMNKVAVSAFSKADNAYIDQWAGREYFFSRDSFEVEFRRRSEVAESVEIRYSTQRQGNTIYYTFGPDGDKKAGVENELKGWYSMVLENERDLPLEGARMQYVIFYELDSTEGDNERQVTGSMAVPVLRARQEIELETDSVALRDFNMRTGYTYNETGKSTLKDRMRGVWVRMYKDGVLLFEASMPEGLKHNRDWPSNLR